VGRNRGGILLAGWGAFNFVEGLIDHQVLGIQHVRDDLGAPLGWDLAFLSLGVLLLAVGFAMAHTGERVARQPASASPTPESVDPSGREPQEPAGARALAR
jgi:uncharacterized membrane protein